MPKRIGTEPDYNFVRHGSFGKFQSANTLPLYHLSTTLRYDEIDKLTYAGNLKPDPNKINFEMLMQRDLDLDRVRDKLVPYIEGRSGVSSASGSMAEPIFFPPLIVAVVPVVGEQMQEYLDERKYNPIDDDRFAMEWGDSIQFEFFRSSGKENSLDELETDGNGIVGYDREPVSLKLKLSGLHNKGVRMVVIDGQHRLAAIDVALKRQGGEERLKNLSIPVCIVVSPWSYQTSKFSSRSYPAYEVYRKLFVDVNSTMEVVSGHFNVLLRDHDVGGLICRSFCDYVLDKHGLEGLALIEWNTKSSKEANRVIRPWSVANVKVLDLSLKKSFGLSKRTREFRALVNAELIDNTLDGIQEDGEERESIKYDRFDLEQSEQLRTTIKDRAAPLLESLIFGLKGNLIRKEIFYSRLQWIDKEASKDTSEAVYWTRVKEHILSYKILAEDDKEGATLLRKFKDFVELDVEERSSRIFQYAIFQRALIEAWATVIEFSLTQGIELAAATQGVVDAWNEFLGEKAAPLSATKTYMQYLVFDGINIDPKERTRKALADLLVGVFANDSVREKFFDTVNVHGDERESISRRLADDAVKSLGEYLGFFKDAREKRLRMGEYSVDSRIEDDLRERLRAAKSKLDEDYTKLKKGSISRDEISIEFESLIVSIAKKETANAAQELSKTFNYDYELVELESEEEKEDDSAGIS